MTEARGTVSRRRRTRVLEVLGSPTGGIRRHVHDVIRHLDPGRFDVYYAHSTLNADTVFWQELDDIRAHTDGVIGLAIEKGPGWRDPGNLLRLARFVRERRVDVVHGHGASAGAYARLLRPFTGARSIYTPHGGALHPVFSRLKRRLFLGIERALLPLTSHLVFESAYTARLFRQNVGWLPNDYTINHHGLAMPDVEPVADRLPGSLPRVGVFAVLRPLKGPQHALQALIELAARGRAAELHFFGDGELRSSLEAEAARAGLAGNVRFHGDVTDVWPHMAAMDIVLIPSEHESFGYVALEAASLGKPLVATAVGGLLETTSSEGSIRVPAADPGAIADAVARLLDDPTSARRIGEIARERVVRRFSMERMIARLSDVYEFLAARR